MEPEQDLEMGEHRTPDTTSQPTDIDLSLSEDWTSLLDEKHDVEVLELRTGSSQWEPVSVEDVENQSTLPENVQIRLYLVEGLAQETLSYFSTISRDFFRNHYLNVLPFDRSDFSKDYFYGKWSRRVYQNQSQWDIEDRIAKNRPYDLDLIIDPKDLGLSHRRYERARRIYRPYSSLAPNAKPEKGYIRQAVEDCVSIRFQRVDSRLIGVVLFDPTHKVRVTRKSYRRGKERLSTRNGSSAEPEDYRDCFSHFKPSRRRFREQLESLANLAALTQSPERNIRDIILRFILDDYMVILSDFREILDFIDEHISNDLVLRDCLQHWRNLFGQWKRNLSNNIRSIAYVVQALHYEQGLGPEDGKANAVTLKDIGSAESVLRPPMRSEFDSLSNNMNRLIDRAGSTFQAIMATMAIIESQKAIAQAETISKLTNMAFVFIPLTLCASIFGMNIVEWQNELRTWLWILVSIMTVLVTYIALYFDELITALSRGPKYLQKLDVNNTAQQINRSSLYLVYYSKKIGRGIVATIRFFFTKAGLFVILILTLFIGGIWAVARSNLSTTQGEAVVCVLVLIVPFAIWIWIGCFGGDLERR